MSEVSTRSCSRPAGSTGSGWPVKSVTASTTRRVELERACVAAIGGGCLAPIAAHHDGMTLTALVADPDGAWVERRTGDDPAALAAELAAFAA